jgi:hypothetical protein
MSAVLELPTDAHGRNNSCRRHGADSTDARNPAAILIGLEDRVDPAIKGCDPSVDLPHEVEQVAPLGRLLRNRLPGSE